MPLCGVLNARPRPDLFDESAPLLSDARGVALYCPTLRRGRHKSAQGIAVEVLLLLSLPMILLYELGIWLLGQSRPAGA